MPETNSSKIFKWLQEHLGPELKILIIPYKRDMWDCFEGIYNIANSTENCSADVMPIPYTCKTSIGEPTRWFLDDFSNIERSHSVDYQKKPKKGEYDVILIHNPYDGANHVTSVHPAFYSDRLRNLTRCLALIPYGIGTVCLLTPGVFNCHVVFAENKTVIESFKQELITEGATPEEADWIANKMVYLGSPKYDLNLNQTVPDEWIPKIKGKKVVLLCTSLQPFLNDPATEMLNVNTVISEFSKKDDYVVIWREHPLMKATILSMRPMYAEAYARFQRNFIEQDLGIMDRTHDYRIAFSVADVLYTDYSSLVTIWQQTGKEIHIL